MLERLNRLLLIHAREAILRINEHAAIGVEVADEQPRLGERAVVAE